MQKITRNIKKGDVWLIENTGAIGHAQQGIRPHVVVTQVTGETVTVAPCTTSEKRKKQKYVVEIFPSPSNGLSVVSYILLAQAFAADKSLFQKRMGTLNEGEILRVQLEFVRYITE